MRNPNYPDHTAANPYASKNEGATGIDVPKNMVLSSDMAVLFFDKTNLDINGKPGVLDFTPTERIKLTSVFKNISTATNRFFEASLSVFEEDKYVMELVEIWFGIKPAETLTSRQNIQTPRESQDILAQVVRKGSKVHYMASSPKQIVTFINQRPASLWDPTGLSIDKSGTVDEQWERRTRLEKQGRHDDSIVKETFSGHGILVKNNKLNNSGYKNDEIYYLILENLITSVLKTDDLAQVKPIILAHHDPYRTLHNTRSWVNFFLGLLEPGQLEDPEGYNNQITW